MARLSLPNEVIEKIWKGVLAPRDVENFNLVSRAVHAQATRVTKANDGRVTSFLQEHRALTKQYRRITTPSFRAPEVLWMLLKRILENPRIGPYVQKLHLQDWAFWSTLEMMPAMTQDEQRVLENALQKVIRADKLHDWLSRASVFVGDAILGLVLAHCPDITELSIDVTHDQEASQVQVPLRRIKADTKAAFPVLGRIKTVSVRFHSSVHHWWRPSGTWTGPINLLTTVASFPSLESITASGNISAYGHRTNLIHSLPKTSNVRSLTLDGCAVDVRELRDIIGTLRSLESFEYTSIGTANFVPNFHTPEICSVLRAHAKSSLQKVVIRDRCIGRNAAPGSHFPRLGDLQALKILGTSLRLFSEQGTPGQSFKSMIVSNVPSSTIVFKIYAMDFSFNRYWIIPEVIMGFVFAKKEHLYGLSVIDICIEFDWTEQERRALDGLGWRCMEAGIALTYSTPAHPSVY